MNTSSIKTYIIYKHTLRRLPCEVLPEDVVDTDHTLWLVVFIVINHSGLSFCPGEAPRFSQQTVLPGAYLSFHKHCKETNYFSI